MMTYQINNPKIPRLGGESRDWGPVFLGVQREKNFSCFETNPDLQAKGKDHDGKWKHNCPFLPSHLRG